MTEIKSTRAGRLWDYIREMYTPHVRISINLLNFTFIYFGLQALAGFPSIHLSWRTLAAAVSVQLLWFMVRVYDELKDADHDIELARRGDPRFTNRPIVTGKVKLEDIAALRWWVTTTLFLLNLPFFSVASFVGLLIAFGYLTLSYKWFFWPKMRHHVMIAYFTHMPNALVFEIYTVAVFIGEFGFENVGASAICLVLALYAQACAFEFTYKIRMPEDETDLGTYSKALGLTMASLVPPVLLSAAVGLTVAVSRAAALSWLVDAIVVTVGVWAIVRCLVFTFRPTRERAKRLTQSAGVYWYVACSALTVGAYVGSETTASAIHPSPEPLP